MNIVGSKVGKWTVVEYAGRDKKSNKLYKCMCDCGTERIQASQTLNSGRSTQCKKCRMADLNATGDLTGSVINGSLVLGRTDNANGEAQYLLRCGCGTEKRASSYRLKKGLSAKCPQCRVKTHGGCYTSTFKIWSGMKSRCTNPKLKCYKYYGGRGISICDRWMKFENFVEDMGWRPGDLTIDRIDCDGNYEPSNCRWITLSENSRNKNRRVA